MRERNQGGSLAGFLIIGVLLALVLVGGLYGLNRYNAQKNSEEVAVKDESGWSTTDPKTETKEDDKQGEEEQKKPAEQPKVETPRASESASTTQPAATQATQLPQTGPADTLLNLFAVGALTFAGTVYIRSRNASV